jgi:hypothetical protein
VLAVDAAIKGGKEITDPDVGRYFALAASLQQALVSITRKDHKDHRAWSEWWTKEGGGFKVQD